MHPDEPVNKTAVGRFIGNAVPVKLGEVIGKSIIRHVTAVKSGNTSRKECEDD
jgi:DNA (cytosine-5)-methyltransferase 1